MELPTCRPITGRSGTVGALIGERKASCVCTETPRTPYKESAESVPRASIRSDRHHPKSIHYNHLSLYTINPPQGCCNTWDNTKPQRNTHSPSITSNSSLTKKYPVDVSSIKQVPVGSNCRSVSVSSDFGEIITIFDNSSQRCISTTPNHNHRNILLMHSTLYPLVESQPLISNLKRKR